MDFIDFIAGLRDTRSFGVAGIIEAVFAGAVFDELLGIGVAAVITEVVAGAVVDELLGRHLEFCRNETFGGSNGKRLHLFVVQ